MAQLAAQPGAATRNEMVILRASGLKKSFRMGESEVHVLKGADLSVKSGEFVAIEGRSGSGKSTLLHILAGLDAPDAGAVVTGAVDIGALALAVQRRRRWFRDHIPIPRLGDFFDLIQLAFVVTDMSDRRLALIRNNEFGFVFQFYHLLPELNVLENTLLASMIEHSWFGFKAKHSALKERAIKVLEQLGVGHRLKHRPNQLSGGERQRVAIARALMNSPRVLFADEPTGNLDFETGKQIMGVLENLHKTQNQTIVMVTHDRTIARQADRILVLKDGRLEGVKSEA